MEDIFQIIVVNFNNMELINRILLFSFLIFLVNDLSAQIVKIEELSVKDTVKFKGVADLKLNVIQNGNSVLQYSSGLQLQYKDSLNTFLSLNGINASFASQITLQNNGFQHLRYKRILSSKWRWEAFEQIQFDQLLNLRSRLLLGTGPKWNLQKHDKVKIALSLAAMYEREQDYNLNTLEFLRISSKIGLHWNLKKNLIIQMEGYFQPSINDIADFRMITNANLSTKVTKHLAFESELVMGYDSTPFEGAPSLFYRLNNGFTYNF